MKYRFSDTEIKKLMKENFMILYDTREQVNEHVLCGFDDLKFKYKKQKIDEGDYTGIITARPDMGIPRDLYFPIGVERKNSVDELAGNLSEKCDTRDDIRLERELIRAKAKGIDIYFVIEDPIGLKNIQTGNYRSQYKPKAFMGKFTSLMTNYTKGATFCSNTESAYHIARHLYYGIRNFLKEGQIYEGGEIIGEDNQRPRDSDL
ncbi:ERCC4 domain-containing protein [uncultured Clostridium sp.]|uniref:ERCC4 domain-containing protein n=1 Tax=uncultured Clostridium sp. TaxID=59620 RepID=UPI0025E0A750|nr:ERCC4 domain-containing protein [uncultured Clostridium sp.]